MKIIKELIIIFGIFLAGEFLAYFLDVPFLGSIVGMLLLILFMFLKVIKETDLEKLPEFFDENMSLFFIPPAVEVLKIFDLFEDKLFQLLIIIFVTTILTFLATYFTAFFLIKILYRDGEKQ